MAAPMAFLRSGSLSWSVISSPSVRFPRQQLLLDGRGGSAYLDLVGGHVQVHRLLDCLPWLGAQCPRDGGEGGVVDVGVAHQEDVVHARSAERLRERLMYPLDVCRPP